MLRHHVVKAFVFGFGILLSRQAKADCPTFDVAVVTVYVCSDGVVAKVAGNTIYQASYGTYSNIEKFAKFYIPVYPTAIRIRIQMLSADYPQGEPHWQSAGDAKWTWAHWDPIRPNHPECLLNDWANLDSVCYNEEGIGWNWISLN